MDDHLHYDRFGEIETWVINGKKYVWNDGFHIPVQELKKLAIHQLPLNEKVQPIDKEDENYIVPTFPDLHLIRTEKGIVLNVETILSTTHWTHPVVSMHCFCECLIEEVNSNEEFHLIEYSDDDSSNQMIVYETLLVDVQTMNEALKSAVHSLKSLEKRVNWRIADKVREWASEIKPNE